MCGGLEVREKQLIWGEKCVFMMRTAVMWSLINRNVLTTRATKWVLGAKGVECNCYHIFPSQDINEGGITLQLSFLSWFLSSSFLKETRMQKTLHCSKCTFFPGRTYYENTPEMLDGDFLLCSFLPSLARCWLKACGERPLFRHD